jgi:hypothetical protein
MELKKDYTVSVIAKPLVQTLALDGRSNWYLSGNAWYEGRVSVDCLSSVISSLRLPLQPPIFFLK